MTISANIVHHVLTTEKQSTAQPITSDSVQLVNHPSVLDTKSGTLCGAAFRNLRSGQ